MGNKPTKGKLQVFQILVAAPAFGDYLEGSTITPDQQKHLAFLCALAGYRAQIKTVVDFAIKHPRSTMLCLKPTTTGLGEFKNDVDSVAKGFEQALKEYQPLLQKHKNSCDKFRYFQKITLSRKIQMHIRW